MSEFFNRDISWLKFNERVLAQAKDSRVPLLERARFLSIFQSNLDEFFMKRMSLLRGDLVVTHVPSVGEANQATNTINEAREIIKNKNAQAHQIYIQICQELKNKNIYFEQWSELTPEEQTSAKDYFLKKVFPLLTPLAVDKSHPFPFLSNLSVSLGIILTRPKKGEEYFARVKIPNTLPQWLQISGEKPDRPRGSYRFLSLIDLISENLSELFPEMVVKGTMPFRITRNANIGGDNDDDDDDRLNTVEEQLRMRRVAQIVRFEHGKRLEAATFEFLRKELELKETDLYEVPGPISYLSLSEIANLNIPELRFAAHTPSTPEFLKEEGRDIFSLAREQDILMHHPYESFNDSVERLVREAVHDPDVLAIKITLYRAGENNPIVPLLILAAEKGKQVVAIIELMARFDEARNIYWGEMLESAGVHVIYGVVGKKIHSKILLIIRKEGDSYRYYSHIGTGNYNPSTAKLYTDLSLITSDKQIGNELIEVFNFLTGLSLKKNYNKILVAPVNMRRRFLGYIQKEIEHQKATGNGHIIAKMNALEDGEVIHLLYKASQAGVKVELIVRGFCTLKPGVKDLSENIKVHSIIGRFLEHSRIYYFRRGSANHLDGVFYISSADWMHRNLSNRIEVAAPVAQTQTKEKLWHVLQTYLNDQFQSWELDAEGNYSLRKSSAGGLSKAAQEVLIQHYAPGAKK